MCIQTVPHQPTLSADAAGVVIVITIISLEGWFNHLLQKVKHELNSLQYLFTASLNEEKGRKRATTVFVHPRCSSITHRPPDPLLTFVCVGRHRMREVHGEVNTNHRYVLVIRVTGRISSHTKRQILIMSMSGGRKPAVAVSRDAEKGG